MIYSRDLKKSPAKTNQRGNKQTQKKQTKQPTERYVPRPPQLASSRLHGAAVRAASQRKYAREASTHRRLRSRRARRYAHATANHDTLHKTEMRIVYEAPRSLSSARHARCRKALFVSVPSSPLGLRWRRPGASAHPDLARSQPPS
jgi:hypothetical protein